MEGILEWPGLHQDQHPVLDLMKRISECAQQRNSSVAPYGGHLGVAWPASTQVCQYFKSRHTHQQEHGLEHDNMLMCLENQHCWTSLPSRLADCIFVPLKQSKTSLRVSFSQSALIMTAVSLLLSAVLFQSMHACLRATGPADVALVQPPPVQAAVEAIF